MELQGVAKELFWKIVRKEIGDMAKWRHSKSKKNGRITNFHIVLCGGFGTE